MLSVDTNILLYAHDLDCPEHTAAAAFLRAHADDAGFALCELVLVELYVLLRNAAILARPLSPADAVATVQAYRSNRSWSVIECADGIMSHVWRQAGGADFARRRIFDARLALTLQRHGVRELATRNTSHFDGLGFDKVWDPIASAAAPTLPRRS